MKTIIRNGRVIDPANGIDRIGNVVIESGKIAAVLSIDTTADADRILNAEGCVVCPGFIDIHMHEDADIEHLDRNPWPIMNGMLRMGVTTAIGGNCGSNAIPPERYLDFMDEGQPVNMGMLVGVGYCRSRAGHRDRYMAVTEAELQREIELIRAALDAGCLGVSYGIRYTPGCNEHELLETARMVTGTDKLITAHVRDDAAYIFDAIREFLEIAKAAEVRAEISHIGSMGGFGQMAEVLKLVERYRAGGVDCMMDCYPYNAFSTSIGATTYDEGWLERYDTDYSSVEICAGPYVGRRCDKALFDKVRAEAPGTGTICHVMRSEEVDLALRHPLVMLGSDGTLDNGEGHPRAMGTFARFFKNYAAAGKTDFSTAIAKMTTMAAKMLRLDRKGNFSSGSDADVVIFDPNAFADHATFDQPRQAPTGIRYVLIGGEIAVENDNIVNAKLGKSVRR